MMMNLPCLRGSYPNFLRSTYHTLSASQAPRRVMPHGKYRCRLQLLFFCLIVTDLRSTVMILIYSVDATPLQPSVGLCADVVHFTLPSDLRVLFQNPVQSPMPSINHSTEFWSYFFYFICYAAIGACEAVGRLISFNSFCGS